MPRKDETIPPNAHRDRIKISQKNARCRGAEGDAILAANGDVTAVVIGEPDRVGDGLDRRRRAPRRRSRPRRHAPPGRPRPLPGQGGRAEPGRVAGGLTGDLTGAPPRQSARPRARMTKAGLAVLSDSAGPARPAERRAGPNPWTCRYRHDPAATRAC